MSNRFPSRPTPRDALFRELEAAREGDVDWRGGRLGIYTHFGGEDVPEVDEYLRDLEAAVARVRSGAVRATGERITYGG